MITLRAFALYLLCLANGFAFVVLTFMAVGVLPAADARPVLWWVLAAGAVIDMSVVSALVNPTQAERDRFRVDRYLRGLGSRRSDGESWGPGRRHDDAPRRDW